MKGIIFSTNAIQKLFKAIISKDFPDMKYNDGIYSKYKEQKNILENHNK